MARQQGLGNDGACKDKARELALELRRDAGRFGLKAMRERASETLCDLTSVNPADEFETKCSVANLGSAVFFETEMTPARLDRTPLHVARGGLDHYQVRMFLEGGFHADCGGSEVEIGPGSIGICDMAERERFDLFAVSTKRSARLLTLFLPRRLVSPLLRTPDSVASTIISGEAPYGRLLGDHLVSVWRALQQISPLETEAVVNATAALVAGGMGVSAEGRRQFSHAYHEAKRAAIKRYIKDRAGSPGLSIEFLAGTFGVSRASLFRLFEADGGPARYIQKCRLNRALATLTSPSHRHRSVLDIALDCCFATEGSFIRAFRRTFGVTPGELRKMVDSPSVGSSAEDEADGTSVLARALLWLERLSAPASPMGDQSSGS
jgi:AraC-like DNA-binding protein